ncbi:telomere-associated protein RIF1 isoform X2 [Dasypus novemcinctus]|uniref:telomere-associated protein RIF1 isoform X2 n=1 Tax=Dasypus novemcinctus TaxID=9361 RepID=UPI00265E20D0|nr:telomere-associated protein RIF1 isoform X2 [Dasypus novemcinctus]
MTAPGHSPLAPLLETLEDASASLGEQTDAYLSLTSRMTGEEGKDVITEIEKKLPRLYKVLKTHISSQNLELCSAALQALGFCLYNPKITSGLSETNSQELLSKLNDIVKTSDKNVRTRALWVISKQTFPGEVVGKVVSSIIDSLEIVFNKGEMHSAVADYEALNVIIRLIEQAPVQMGEEAVRWAKLVIPLVVHSAQKVHLRGATALEMGMPLLLQKQQEVASITEQLMTTKLISELQKLFMTKNETYVLKLWPLFVKLLGKTLHRSGSFINSLLQLEELGFRSGAPMIKKIAFIAWKSLIDNFALNPDILCSAKRLKLLMQPLSSIHVRTESLALTKLEVWWYLLMRLGPHLPANFEQVCVPLIQSTISIDSNVSPQGNSSRVSPSPNLSPVTPVHKGASPYGAPVTPRMNMSSNLGGMAAIPSIQLLGLEMLLHFLLGPEVLNFAKQNKLVLSLEPLEHSLINSPSFFGKHANTLITAVHDSFVAVGKDASDLVVNAIWKELINLVNSVIESGNKKERPGSEVLTLLLKSLESIVKSEAYPVSKTLVLMEITIKGLPQKVLGSPAYQGTPALFLIQLIFNNNLLECGVADERFFLNMETLVGCVLSGPTSPLAFSDSVLNVINQNAKQLENKEHLWRMWSIIVNPLTELINQTNEVNQGDALEHNFSAIYGALILPINYIFSEQTFPMATMKTLLRTWSELYRAFARCAALVATAEENLCCEELSSKIMSSLEDETLSNLLFLDRIVHIINVMVDCIDFSPYNIKYQPQVKLPQTPSDWSKKKKEPLGKLASLFKLIVRVIYSFHTLSFKEVHSDTLLTVGISITSILSNVLGHISLPSMIQKMFATLTRPLALLYENSKCDEVPKVYSCLNNKLEKLLGEIIACLQFSYTGIYDSEFLEQLSPLLCVVFLHKNKQIQKQSAQFWNATFGKVNLLFYPEDLKPVLRQAKQKFLLLLPGLENVDAVEESSGSYSESTENSQLNMKISGMEIKSNRKRDSLLAQTKDTKENMKTPAKLKLESSPKINSEVLLEEEKSTDFVFIPPEGKEAKERILTEHQKEVLKTKRGHIPAMYNNLDVSQDTLFSQLSQEESMEIPTLIEKPKEDCKMMSKEEQMKSSTIPQDITENCGTDEHLVKASLSNIESGSIEETNPEILSSDNDARKQVLLSSKKTSPDSMSSAENTFAVCSSSASHATISGMPPQPTSRRQTFITLEKFDGSESRPFSPSPLNNMSSPISVKNNQENMTKTDIPLKAKKREVTPSKSDSEKIVKGVKRSCRRSSKAEQVGNKKSKPLMRSEEEKISQESTDGIGTLENNSPDLLNQTECISNNQAHLFESATESEDTKLESVVENTVLLDNNTVEEKNLGINLESKENTPPVIIPADQLVNEDSQAQITQNQKTLRRSLRRRSEIVESTSDSQDKENNHQKKERRKEEEKPLQKSPLHVKDDVLPKHKLITEQTVLENLIKKENNFHEKTLGETSTNTEIDQSRRKPEVENTKSDGDGAQDTADKSSEKPIRGRTRYQTRRASQGLLSSIENSESDSSEAKEESSRKKRCGKWKSKSNNSVDNEDQEEQMVKQECVKVENQTCDDKASSEVDIDIVSQTCDKQGDSSTEILKDSAGSSDLLQVSDDVPSTHEEKSKINTCAEYSSPPVPESNLRTRNASKRLHKRDSIENNSVGESSRTETSDFSLPSEKPLQTLECQHKRSRRVRRSKGCDCCGEKSQLQEKTLIGLKNTENYDLKISETKKIDLQLPITMPETSKVNLYSEVKFSHEHHSVNFHLGLRKEENSAIASLIVSETELKENTVQESLSPETANFKEETCGIDCSGAGALESQEPSNKNFKTVGPCIGDSEDNSQDSSLEVKEEKPKATLNKELSPESLVSVEASACKVKERNLEEVEAMELDVKSEKSEASLPELKCAKIDISKEEATEEKNENDDSKADTADELSAGEAATEEFNSGVDHSDTTTAVKVGDITEISEQIAVGEQDRGSDESDSGSSDEVNAKVENREEAVFTEMNAETDGCTEAEAGDMISKTSEPEETETKKLRAEIDTSFPDTLEMNTEEGKIVSSKIETSTQLHQSEETETELDAKHIVMESEEILDHCTLEKVEEPSQSPIPEISELITEDNNASPQKLKELDPSIVSANDSPSGMQTRCVWSPLASPSTSILKRGLKRPQEDEIASPINKVRRVSFADPIYQAGLADDIDRRCSIVRAHSSNSSPVVKSVKISPTAQLKHNTTSIKGFLSPGSRSPKFKSSKKCLITEMTKESVPCPTESVYPALVNCVAPVDIILPQITSNMWARGLGQLIRAKNIKTIGDLSTLTASEIKTLPIRSPKVSNVKKALRIYHEQQVKSRGLEEIPAFDISEKTVNGIENKSLSPDEERLASDLIDPVALETPLSKNLVAQISALALQLNSEDLHNYSGSQLFEMHEKLGSMANSIIKNLQSRWKSPAHENST